MNEHHHATPELTSERAMQEWLKELIENATWDSGLYETEVLSFEETQSKPVNREGCLCTCRTEVCSA